MLLCMVIKQICILNFNKKFSCIFSFLNFCFRLFFKIEADFGLFLLMNWRTNWVGYLKLVWLIIININTIAIDCLWFVMLDTLHIVTLHTGATLLCRLISRRVCVTGSHRRLSVAGSHMARAGEAGFLPISAGKASNNNNNLVWWLCHLTKCNICFTVWC